ncbi:MAG: cytochrome d ubiquinol oxidase subunit II [Pseudomonadota bacterium]|nr:cytochrome d ubiquinol oxidase subunit II [Pseudomonadota bacterium]
MDLTPLQWFWMLALAFSLLIYLILDGFDLGVGILFGTTRNDAWRSTMMRTIAPVWDGNETWLLAAGAGLYAAFPVVYAIFFSALYLPVVLMLCGLVFRGVAFEFRVRATRHRKLWDRGFFAGSLVVSFVQGAAVGALIEELAVEQGQYVGGPLDWLSPFAIVCGIGLVAGYCLHGACWLVAKTRGELREWAWRRIPWLAGLVVAILLCLFAWVQFTALDVAARWQSPTWRWALPLSGALAIVWLARGILQRRDLAPFAGSSLLFLSAYAALLASFEPYMIPYSVTVSEAAAPESALSFLFYGAGLFVLPVILIYTMAVYRIFRGKVD